MEYYTVETTNSNLQLLDYKHSFYFKNMAVIAQILREKNNTAVEFYSLNGWHEINLFVDGSTEIDTHGPKRRVAL